MSRRITPLDTSIQIVTAENVAFSYHVAGPFRRLPAYLIDKVIIILSVLLLWILMGLLTGLAGLPGIGFGMVLAFMFFANWFYGGLFEAYWNGQTPGKRMMRIRVLSQDGQPITGSQAVMRNLLRYLDLQPIGLAQVGLISASSNARFQRVGDLACGTMVVVEDENWLKKPITMKDPMVSKMAEQIPSSYRAEPSLVRTLSLYVQRRKNLSPPRRVEIARHIGIPLAEKFQLSPQINPDLLLCALYYKTFHTDNN